MLRKVGLIVTVNQKIFDKCFIRNIIFLLLRDIKKNYFPNFTILTGHYVWGAFLKKTTYRSELNYKMVLQ